MSSCDQENRGEKLDVVWRKLAKLSTTTFTYRSTLNYFMVPGNASRACAAWGDLSLHLTGGLLHFLKLLYLYKLRKIFSETLRMFFCIAHPQYRRAFFVKDLTVDPHRCSSSEQPPPPPLVPTLPTAQFPPESQPRFEPIGAARKQTL